PTFYSLTINILTSCFLFFRSQRATLSAWTLIARLIDHPWLIISSCDWSASRNSCHRIFRQANTTHIGRLHPADCALRSLDHVPQAGSNSLTDRQQLFSFF